MSDSPPPYTGPEIPDQEMVAVSAGELAELLHASGPGPRQRVGRSIKQQVLALLASIPVSITALVAAGVDVDPKIAAIAVGVPTAAGGIVAAVWNLIDAARGNG